MEILFITHKFPPSVGGMEKQSFELIEGYKKISKVYTIIYNGEESYALFFIRLKSRVDLFLKKYPSIHLIHLNDGLMAAFFKILRIDVRGRKLAVTYHGLDIVFPLKIYQNMILPKIASSFDLYICVSQATKAECIKRNFDPDLISVIHNGVEESAKIDHFKDHLNGEINPPFIYDKRDKILLILGRPVKRKGFSWLAREVMPLLEENYKLVHIGDISTKWAQISKFLPQAISRNFNLFFGIADDTYDLKMEAKARPNQIFLLGKLSSKEKDYWILKSDLMVMPNIEVYGDMEGFGLVALEAASLGKNILVSDLEGLKDAITHEKNGFLALSGNREQWALSITNYCNYGGQYSDRIRDFTFENFSWKKMVDEYKKAFEALCKENGQ